MGEEAISANFRGKGKVKANAHNSSGYGDDEANMAGQHYDKKKKDKKRCWEEMVAAADRATHSQPKGRGQRQSTSRGCSRSPAHSMVWRPDTTSSRTVGQ